MEILSIQLFHKDFTTLYHALFSILAIGMLKMVLSINKKTKVFCLKFILKTLRKYYIK